MKSNERVALVTGSTSGIGKAIALQLSDDGFNVVFHSKKSVDEGQRLASSIPRATYIQADLSDQEQAKGLVSQALSLYGRMDVLVNNAGINAMIPHGSLKQASPAVWRELYEGNVIAPWTLIAEAEQALRASSCSDYTSSIINISSHAGVRPKGASIPYAASKASLNHMTQLLALTLSPEIRVNAIAPGLVNTPMAESWVEAQKLWTERSPMKRGAEPLEIAHTASMLVSSSYLTGEIILSDGGLNLT
ncbi:MAG: short-chain dehydrogenase [Pseudomonadales bacterium]|nr:short-chain dehydrogenase [Pseudomonadales bacterium]